MSELIVNAVIRTRPGAGDALVEAFAPCIRGSRAEPGCRWYELFRSTEDPESFVVFEGWDDPEALEAHTRTPHYRDLLESTAGLLAREVDLLRLRREA